MTNVSSHAVPEQRRIRRAITAVGVFLKSMESTTFDSTLDRIERLEREMGGLKEELRLIRDPAAIVARNA